jgi:hypothetical protein
MSMWLAIASIFTLSLTLVGCDGPGHCDPCNVPRPKVSLTSCICGERHWACTMHPDRSMCDCSYGKDIFLRCPLKKNTP